MSVEEKLNQAKGAIKEGVGKVTDDKKTEKCGTCQKEIENGCLLQSQIITPTMMKSINSQSVDFLLKTWDYSTRNLRLL